VLKYFSLDQFYFSNNIAFPLISETKVKSKCGNLKNTLFSDTSDDDNSDYDDETDEGKRKN
jgi:hypothetical protein